MIVVEKIKEYVIALLARCKRVKFAMNKTSIKTTKHIHSIIHVEREMVVENKITNNIAYVYEVILNTYRNIKIKPMYLLNK